MLIGISGMVSSGKSTLSNKLFNHFKNSLLLKEFDEDKDGVFHTLLDIKFKNQGNSSINFSFEAYILENHLNCLDKLLNQFDQEKNKYIFLDRFSLEHGIFALTDFMFQKFPKRSFEAYKAMSKIMVEPRHLPELIIYLDVSFDTFKQRIFNRQRDSEVENWNLNEPYFRLLFDNYKKHFLDLLKNANINYIVIDTNDLNEDQVFEVAKEAILQFQK
ncbi:deoxynucleoside kinase [Mycoplasma sp. NEAQ87857]|uniref:deoxynucleoside kinase n=1 Tax=Mycoplasma sp. NEAQ87857 TaxID=2683967 RepID=UPI0013182B55|nr:deoxynucleoside kinase [Mycoplasma sp. NEAQ87857]QGZ97769.1 deoxynucleoside kinase [Mycoplasma sp. NEAQ87857]